MDDTGGGRRDGGLDRLEVREVFRKRTSKPKATPRIEDLSELEQIDAWVLSLPWVVERPHSHEPGVRMFAVDCEPLGLRRVWLATGLGLRPPETPGRVAVVLPLAAAQAVEESGRRVRGAPMPASHVVIQWEVGAGLADTESLILTAYSHAMSD
ncbi:MAG TPA: hypothetical protein VIA11_13425 [Acidimicrobiia bacterium]|nr:hypothetical protein [Acidimicrobiia bacterium]